MTWLVAVPLLACLLFSPAVRADQARPIPIPFTAERWQARQGRWRFERDGTLTCAGRGIGSLLFLKGERLRDLELSVEVMFLGPESSAGLVFRSLGEHYFDDMSFYQFEWYTQGHHHGRRLSLMKKNPRPRSWSQIVTPELRSPPTERWIRLRIHAEGDLVQAFVDDRRVFEKRDRSYLRPGRLGLHVFQPRPVRFRNLRLTRL